MRCFRSLCGEWFCCRSPADRWQAGSYGLRPESKAHPPPHENPCARRNSPLPAKHCFATIRFCPQSPDSATIRFCPQSPESATIRFCPQSPDSATTRFCPQSHDSATIRFCPQSPESATIRFCPQSPDSATIRFCPQSPESATIRFCPQSPESATIRFCPEGVGAWLAGDLARSGSKPCRCGVSGHYAVNGFAAGPQQIAGKPAPTACGQNQKPIRPVHENSASNHTPEADRNELLPTPLPAPQSSVFVACAPSSNTRPPSIPTPVFSSSATTYLLIFLSLDIGQHHLRPQRQKVRQRP